MVGCVVMICWVVMGCCVVIMALFIDPLICVVGRSWSVLLVYYVGLLLIPPNSLLEHRFLIDSAIFFTTEAPASGGTYREPKRVPERRSMIRI